MNYLKLVLLCVTLSGKIVNQFDTSNTKTLSKPLNVAFKNNLFLVVFKSLWFVQIA